MYEWISSARRPLSGAVLRREPSIHYPIIAWIHGAEPPPPALRVDSVADGSPARGELGFACHSVHGLLAWDIGAGMSCAMRPRGALWPEPISKCDPCPWFVCNLIWELLAPVTCNEQAGRAREGIASGGSQERRPYPPWRCPIPAHVGWVLRKTSIIPTGAPSWPEPRCKIPQQEICKGGAAAIQTNWSEELQPSRPTGARSCSHPDQVERGAAAIQTKWSSGRWIGNYGVTVERKPCMGVSACQLVFLTERKTLASGKLPAPLAGRCSAPKAGIWRPPARPSSSLHLVMNGCSSSLHLVMNGCNSSLYL
eukprot:gene19907-biopygen7018